jgi:RNA polymerase sigma factor (sigma-70 family)
MTAPWRRYQLDGQEIADIYRRDAEAILGFLLRRTFNRDVALDLLAETFAQAFADRRQFRGRDREHARAWIYGIARHQAATYFRRGHAEQRALRALGIERPPWQDPDIERIEDLAGIAELRASVAERMKHLSRDQQQAVERRIVEEVDYRDIADELGVSEDTVRARVSRALRLLADEINTAERP